MKDTNSPLPPFVHIDAANTTWSQIYQFKILNILAVDSGDAPLVPRIQQGVVDDFL